MLKLARDHFRLKPVLTCGQFLEQARPQRAPAPPVRVTDGVVSKRASAVLRGAPPGYHKPPCLVRRTGVLRETVALPPSLHRRACLTS